MLNRQIGRPGTLQDTIDVSRNRPHVVGLTGPVGHEAPRRREFPTKGNRRQPVAKGEFSRAFEPQTGLHHHPRHARPRGRLEGIRQIAGRVDRYGKQSDALRGCGRLHLPAQGHAEWIAIVQHEAEKARLAPDFGEQLEAFRGHRRAGTEHPREVAFRPGDVADPADLGRRPKEDDGDILCSLTCRHDRLRQNRDDDIGLRCNERLGKRVDGATVYPGIAKVEEDRPAFDVAQLGHGRAERQPARAGFPGHEEAHTGRLLCKGRSGKAGGTETQEQRAPPQSTLLTRSRPDSGGRAQSSAPSSTVQSNGSHAVDALAVT